MSNGIVKAQGRTIMPMSSVFDDVDTEGELTSGVAISFPILGIKGKVFHYRFKGEDATIPLPNNPNIAAPMISVVLVKGHDMLTRTFYPLGSYQEGVNNRPVCWSSDGVRPDDTVPEPVNPVCATCPNAEWGSGATPAAPRAQACQQRRRVVVVPYSDDLTNEAGGGPMLLSVPPSTLKPLLEYGVWLKDQGLKSPGVVTQLSFDKDSAFPKVAFDYLASLNDDEAGVIKELRDSEQVARILNSKINVDGPEVDDTEPEPEPAASARGAPPKPSMPRGATAGAQPPKPAMPKTAGQAAVAQATRAEPQQAQPMPPPPPPKTPLPVKGATQPTPKTPPPRVGGFGVPPAGKPAAPIADAVSQPAKPPPSARPVMTTPQPVRTAAPPPPTEEETTGDGGDGEETVAASADDVSAELDARFGKLVNRA